MSTRRAGITATGPQLAAARRAAQFAARMRLPVTACPYNPAGDQVQRACASLWMRTYLHLRPPLSAVSYDDDSE